MPDELIGLLADPHPDTLTGLLGVLKSGKGFVPLDPRFPDERIALLAADCGLRVLVTHGRYAERAVRIAEGSPCLREIVCLDPPGRDIADIAEIAAVPGVRVHVLGASPAPTLPAISATDGFDARRPAYAVYTSGSTGRPKGVPISHENLLPMLAWAREYFGLGEHTRVLQNLSFGFDFGIFELLTTLVSGGTLHYLREEEAGDPALFARAVAERGINTIHSTPAFAAEVAAAGAPLGGLEIVHLGGEALSRGAVARIREAVGERAAIYNGYGPTEVTVNSTIFRDGTGGDEALPNLPIGRRSAGNLLYVLDRGGRPAPPGVPGELQVGGIGVARGYLNRPELTAERFVPDPFSGVPGARLYRTGDLVRWLADGQIDFLGRIDTQVKIRGYRVEPGEIEAVLREHPAVLDAAVVARPEPSGTRRLVAYVATEEAAGELRSFLSGRLPSYMVPSAFVTLAALPRTPNGKLDRRALPEPVFASAAGTSEPPATLLEETVAEACCTVLGLAGIGRHDDLFELGCHSLLATRIVARLRETLGVQLPLRSLFEAPTVAGLAAAVEQGSGGGEMPAIEPAPRDGELPLSFAQERVWFLHQLEPESVAYHVPRALRIRGPLSVPLLEEVFSEIVRRHEILRTTFPARDGQPLQVINDPWRMSIPVVDLSACPASEREERLAEFIVEHGRRPFDLERGPLMRFSVVRLEDEEHALVMTEHHFVHDGWTQGVLLKDFLALYAAFGRGEPSPLPPLPVQYADFAVWQRRWLRGDVLDRQLAWWRERLAGAPELLELPTDLPRPAVRSARGHAITWEIPLGLASALRRLSRDLGSTLFMTLTAAFDVLLWRYSGQEDFCLGTVLANRRVREIEGLLGMIVNTLVLRMDLGGEPAFDELTARVREICLGAYEHQDMPIERLVEALRPERSLGHTPLFQVMFSLLDTPTSELELPGLELELMDSHNRSSKFDLNVTGIPHSEQRVGGSVNAEESEITLLVEYSTDLFRRETVERLAGHYLNLLAGVVAEPRRRISELPLLSGEERAQVLAWSAAPAPFRQGVCVHELVAARAAENPEALAVAGGGETLTYGDLVRRAGALARRLRSLGVGPEDKVAVFAGRSPDLLVGLLAVLAAGAAYVPLDPGYPAERLAFLLEDAGAPVVLAQEGLLDRLPRTAARTVLLNGQDGADLPVGLALPENLAYVIHTSGSTGAPKGVEITHASLMNLVDWHVGAYGVGPADRASQVAALGFDAAVWEIWPVLSAGASLHLPDEETRATPERLRAWLAAEGITIAFLPTPLAEAVLDLGGPEPPLRTLLTGGDRLRRYAPEGASFELVNHYGPTEGTVVATWDRVGAQLPGALYPPIGRPMANARTHVLGLGGEPAPVGVPGELWIGGAGLARGYLRRPDLTAERFRPDPLGIEPGARLYGTGDRVRLLADGRLEFLGRADHQVKVRGVRIEPAEIEAALTAHDGVRAAAVLAREGAGGVHLVAYVVPRDSVSPAELREHLRLRLPETMIPAAFVELAELPLTPHGKVDRRALAAVAAKTLPGELEDRAAYMAPRNPVEEVLCGLWAELLGRERVGVRDSFFDLGGHSLLATRLLSRVREVLDAEVPLRRLFEQPTPEGLARAVEELRGATSATSATSATAAAPPIRPVPRAGDLPLSFAQERLWFLDQFEPGGNAYIIPAALDLSGPIDARALSAAFNEILRRHEALRTTFVAVNGRPVQRISPPVPVAVPVVELSGLADPQEEIERWTAAEVRRPFDLARGPLVRLTLFRLGQDEHRALAALHHIVADGWSMGVLVRELALLYTGTLLPELPVQYADYAVWQRGRLQGEVLEQQLAWWREELAGAPPVLDLPFAAAAVPDRRAGRVEIALPAELATALEALGRQGGATLFMTLLAGWSALLSRYTGQDDVLVGSPIANRTRLETEELIGFFVNTLVLRTRLAGDPGFGELLARVRRATLGAYDHQELPFERLVEELQPERQLAHTPFFQVLFVLQNAPQAAVELPGLRVEPRPLSPETAKLDLTLFLTRQEDGLSAVLETSRDRFDAAAGRRLLEHWRNLLEGAVAGPEARVSDLPLLSEAERRQVVVDWNETGSAYPREATIHALFEAQAEATPEALAVTGEGAAWSYAELNRRANRLAHHLRALGVGPEVAVGVSLERSPELIAAILGILKAGGAYVPLDLSYPEERLRFLLDDSGVRLLLSREELESEAVARQSEENPPPAGAADHLAYVMYTSGSTGTPKGVAVTHRSVVRLVRETDYARLGPDEVFLQLAPVSFDASTLEIWGALLNGARLEVFPGRVPSLQELGDALVRSKVTTLWLTAGLFHQMVDEQLGSLAGVRQLLAGGDVLSPAHVRRVLEALPGCTVINGYGPTENTTFTCCRRLTDPGEVGASVPIGRPIANTRVYLLDPGMQPVPVGVAGELYAGGDGLARGYLGRPELTAERFVPDPFAEPGGRLYRTGDLARRKDDGDIEFLGRTDQQVKIRGFRVEPGEVEAALARHPGVREAAVAVREIAGSRALVAWVVGEEGPVPAGELRAHLRRLLPESMIPAAFVTLPGLPLTPNGKVDRRALPEPERETTAAESPRTPVEEVLAGIWADLLGLERVGVHDDFFDLGGHSLLGMQVVSRLREAFGVEMPLRELFANPTLAGLARAIEEGVKHGPVAPPVQPVPRDGDLPLSFSQERLWFLDRLEPGSPAYNVPSAALLEGDLDVPALRRALAGLVDRHESLRTTFHAAAGRPVQVVAPRLVPELPLIDLEEAGETAANRLAEETSLLPFDLEAGPLLRAVLVRLGSRRHVLLLTLHHIVSDGWSTGVLIRDLAALYGAEELPELPVQYADYAAWQRAWLTGSALAPRLAWWRERLAGCPAALDLPTDRPRPAVAGYGGAACRVPVRPETWAEIGALARGAAATPFLVVLAALQALLARSTGAEDLAVGTPVAGRDRLELEGLIGFFVNTLVLRGDLSGDPTFQTLLGRAREALLAAHVHQDLPFERLVEELAPERDLGRTPLFQVLLASVSTEGGGSSPRGGGGLALGGGQEGGVSRIEDGGLRSAPLLISPRFQPPPPRGEEPSAQWSVSKVAGLSLTPIESAPRVAKFDLTFTLTPAGLRLLYRIDLFDPATAERMAGHLARLIEGAVSDPERRLSNLPLMGEAERRELLFDFNATRQDYPLDGTVHGAFTAQARRTPGADAVVCGDLRLTFGELERRALALAAHLRSLGVGPESRVGLSGSRSPESIAGILGILLAGGAYVPVDPSWPEERVSWMMADAGAALLLTDERIAAAWDGPAEAGLPEVAPDGAAYVIYTSGSTGRPKGVVVRHRSVLNLARALREAVYGDSGPLRVAVNASLSFDGSVKQWIQLLSGHALHLVPEETRLDPAALAELLRRGGIDVLDATPSQLRPLLQAGLAADPEGAPRLVLIGGEALDRETWELARSRPWTRFVNVYGPTECTVDATAIDLAEGRVPASIGRPLPNVRVYVADRWGAPAPQGIAGELWIGGEGVARGYLGQPALTAERFVPDPFGEQPGARLYRSGDLVRLRPGREIEFLGRIDQQVKIRGYRVEPGEIEAALRGLPAVREAAVVARDGRLAAYVAPAPGVELTLDGLRRSLESRLPSFLLPSVWVVMERLPLTASGKIDRASLPAPEADAGAASARPLTTTEDLLAGIFTDVLEVEEVGRDGDFFALGGHSLLAARLAARVRDAFGVELPLRALFEAPVVADLAGRLDRLAREAQGLALPPLERVSRSLEPPLSFAQQSLWVIDRMDGGSSAYNGTAAVELAGRLDVAALAGSFRDVVERHEVLRTGFALRNGEPRQVIHAGVDVPMPVADLAALPESRREEAVEAVRNELRRPFDLERAPLLRTALLRFAPDLHVLVLSQHHIVSDAWSMGVLVRELAVGYEARAQGRAPVLPALPVQYADWSHWQRQWLRGDNLDRLLAFWRLQLGSAPPAALLPSARPAPAVRTRRGGRLVLPLPAALEPELRALARREGVTLFMLLLGVFQALLHRSTGQEDMVLVVAVSGRDRVETEGLIGCFLNMVPLRASLAGDPPFRRLLRRVRETCLDAFAHQDLPFERLVGELRLRGADGRPPFQVAFGVRPAPPALPELPGLAVRALDSDPDAARLDLTLWIAERPGELSASWTWSADLFEREEVERLHRAYEALLAAVVADPDALLRDLGLPQERAASARRWAEIKSGKLRELRRRAPRTERDEDVPGTTSRQEDA